MKISGLEPAYEAARTWALYPVGHTPAGWAQISRWGVTPWASVWHPPMTPQSQDRLSVRPSSSPLLTIVAAMIAEVCQ